MRVVGRWTSVLMIAAAAFTPVIASADERSVTFSPKETSVTFKLEATGHEVNGVLPLQSGRIQFEPGSGTVSGEVTIDARRAVTGNRLRDRQMHDEVLESERFPLIVFRPDRITGTLSPSGASDITVHGVVSMHGTEHAVTLPARVTQSGDRIRAEMTFDVPYVDWGLRNPSFLFLRVARVVTVTVKVEGDVRPVAGPARP